MQQTLEGSKYMNLKQAIESSYLAEGLSPSQIERLISIADWRTFKAGEEMVKQFDENKDLLILASGSAHVLTVVGDPIALVQPGMPIGEVALLDDKPRSGTVVAREDCTAVVFPAEPLMNLLMASHDIAAKCLLNLSRILCARLRTANQNLAALMAIEELEESRNRQSVA